MGSVSRRLRRKPKAGHDHIADDIGSAIFLHELATVELAEQRGALIGRFRQVMAQVNETNPRACWERLQELRAIYHQADHGPSPAMELVDDIRAHNNAELAWHWRHRANPTPQ